MHLLSRLWSNEAAASGSGNRLEIKSVSVCVLRAACRTRARTALWRSMLHVGGAINSATTKDETYVRAVARRRALELGSALDGHG